jgi:hypothetical protein
MTYQQNFTTKMASYGYGVKQTTTNAKQDVRANLNDNKGKVCTNFDNLFKSTSVHGSIYWA